MEAYRHSCPFCGQHIEYTAGYCGKQMVCPMCSQNITFPAVPPGKAKSALHIKRTEASETRKWPIDFGPILEFFEKFKHWNVLLACAVPFLIVAGLLYGASFVKQHFNEDADPVKAPAVQADPTAWQKMAALTQADQAVQQQLQNVIAAHNTVLSAQAVLAGDRAQYSHSTITAAVQGKLNQDDQMVQRAQNNLNATRNAFENACRNYQSLGGKVDYEQQAPR